MIGPGTHNASTLAPGYKLDRYELLCPIAEGGMASVWVARQPGKHGFEKLVAIKTILPQFANDARYKTMFLDEARLASKIQHVNVTQILDLGEEQGVLYLAMEYVDGDSLSRLGVACEKDGNRIPPGILARIVADTCSGLHVAHELVHAGRPLEIVHRDVSPQNILISSHGVAKIIDFGVAKARDRLASTTNAGLLKGKIHYMPPEQALERPVDRRSDVWAAGAVLYRYLAGKPPYEGENAIGTLHLLSSKRPPLPLPSTVHAAIGAVVRKALAYEPGNRYQTSAELRDALEGAMIEANVQTTHADVASFTAKHLGDQFEKRRQAIELALAASAERRQPGELPRLAPPPPVSIRDVTRTEVPAVPKLASLERRPALPPLPVPPIPEPSSPIELKTLEPMKRVVSEVIAEDMGQAALKPVARCLTHDLAVASDGKCVRCQREEEAVAETAPQTPVRVGGFLWVIAVIALTGAILLVSRSRSTASSPASGVSSVSSRTSAAPSSPATPAAVDRQTAAPPLVALEPAEIEAGQAATGTSSDGPSPLDRAILLVKIVMYSRPADPECRRLRDWLLAHGHLFQERDVDVDSEARAAWEKAAGTVPALDIDGITLTGFDPARIQAAIDYAGARRAQRGQ